jgi:hypothetical protein
VDDAHHAAMPLPRYLSPLTGDVWPDPRPAIGTIAGLANFLNEKRPRRKPPEGHDAAIAQATKAAAGLAGLPSIERFGPEGITLGAVISDAYWNAKEAKQRLTRLVDDERFLQRQEWWGREWQRRREGGPESFDSHYFERYQSELVSFSTQAARVAWYAANLAEKFAAGTEQEIVSPTVSHYGGTYAHDAVLGALAACDEAGVPREAASGVERIWRFVVAAGRMPVLGVDDDLMAAFEAALIAGEYGFANELVRDT